MKRLFIIGNGFDIAHGLNTKYSHFMKYLLQYEKTPREIIPGFVDMVLCQDLAQNKMRSSATKLLTENRPSYTFFRSR